MYKVDQNTVSLLHFEDEIKDETGKVWTAYNNATVSENQSKFGGKSLCLDSSKTQYISCTNDALAVGSSDFTYDFWVYTSSHQNGCSIINTRTGDTADGINFSYHSGYGNYIVTFRNTFLIVGSILLTLNVWNHVAIVRSGTTLYLFINGMLSGKCTDFTTSLTSTLFSIGYYWGGYFVGNVDELRVSNIARWTSNFTPDDSQNLIAATGNSKINLTWTAVSGAIGYNVKRSTTSGGSYTTIASNITNNSYVDNSVIEGITYYYVVTAISESDNSNEAFATPSK